VTPGPPTRNSNKLGPRGDYAALGTEQLVVGELLCEAVELRAGQRVLDVATGSGNAALAAARRWCEVTAVDWVAALLERGRERAAAERVPITFQEGEAEHLPFAAASFDVVLSTFGVMFAPDQEQAANELLRVCRSGGKIGLASWSPEGFAGQFFRVVARHMPPAPGLRAATEWGTEERVNELLGGRAKILQANHRTFRFRHRSPQDFVDFWSQYSPPVVAALKRLDATGQQSFKRDMLQCFEHFNRSGDVTLLVPSDYLEVVAIKE